MEGWHSKDYTRKAEVEEGTVRCEESVENLEDVEGLECIDLGRVKSMERSEPPQMAPASEQEWGKRVAASSQLGVESFPVVEKRRVGESKWPTGECGNAADEDAFDEDFGNEDFDDDDSFDSPRGVAQGPQRDSDNPPSSPDSLLDDPPFDEAASLPLPPAVAELEKYLAAKPPRKTLHEDMVRCLVVRKGSRNPMAGKRYLLYLQEPDGERLVLAAQRKRKGNGNMHVYDMSRGSIGSRMSKKHGNYVGKIATSLGSKAQFNVYSTARGMEESALVAFDKDGLLDKLVDGVLPRRVCVLIPKRGGSGHQRSRLGAGAGKELMASVHQEFRAMRRPLKSGHTAHVLANKLPVFERGNYRLNFYGRVTIASVKNFQLIERHGDERDKCPGARDILLQFGKIGSDRFHLDFRSPLSPMTAFGIALSQFMF